MNFARNSLLNRNQNAPLTNDALRALAPSVFASAAHESRSARFTPVPTIQVIEGLRREGFEPFAAKQSRCRDAGRADFTKHMVRFRRPDHSTSVTKVGDTFAEIVLVNANDGTSSYKLDGGLFRLACLNGMVVSDKMFDSVRVGHTGDIIGKVIEGSFRVLDNTAKAIEVRREWGGLQLAAGEQMAFARAAHALRFEEKEEGEVASPIEPHQLLEVRRHDDQTGDLWTVFNRVQENTIRGGLTGRTKAGYYRDAETGAQVWKPSRRVVTREVKGIDQDVKLNKALWTLATEMAALKAA